MPCLRTGCNQPSFKDLAGAGIGRGMCKPHFTEIVQEIHKNWPNLPGTYVANYAMIELMLLDNQNFIANLQKLNNAMARQAGVQREAVKSPFYRRIAEDKPYVRLSVVLEKYESNCWFPKVHVLPLGLLSEADFFFYIQNGLVLKDYGAGVKHGEFTHRLQWHAIARAITQDFTIPMGPGWYHSVLELYTRLGHADARNGREGGNTGSSLWGRLFDRGGLGGGNFEPDTAHRNMLNGAGLETLQRSLSRRLQKRREELIWSENVVVPPILKELNRPENVNSLNGGQKFYWRRNLKADPFARVPKVKGGSAMRDADLEQNLALLPPSDPFFETNPAASKKIEAEASTLSAKMYVERKRKQHKWQDPDTLQPGVRLPGGAWKMAGERVPNSNELNALLSQSRSSLNYN